MCLLTVNEDEDIGEGRFRAAAAALPPHAPVIIMVHGFRYSPRTESCPHSLILAERSDSDSWKVVSWPQQLAIPQGRGLGVGFGWDASGTIWQAYRRAPRAGAALADAIAALRAELPQRPIHIVTHSLGARVALHAASLLPPATISRMLLISPAMFRHEAAQLAAAEGLSATEVFTVLSAENTAYDLLFRAVMPWGGVTLGRGGPDLSTWLDIRLNHSPTAEALRHLGYAIEAPRSRICHWSGYLRGGVWALYGDLLYRPHTTAMPRLRERFGITQARAALSPGLSFRTTSPS